MTLTLTVCEPHGVVKVSVKLPRVLFKELTVKVLPEPLTTLRLFGPLAKVTVPFGLTLKLIVPPLCFENVSGLGLVVTWTVHGVGVGIGVGVGVPLGVGVGVGVGVPLGVGVGVGVEIGVGVGSAEIGVGVGVGVGSSCPPGVGVGVAVGLLLPFMVEPESIPVSEFTFTLTFGTSSR